VQNIQTHSALKDFNPSTFDSGSVILFSFEYQTGLSPVDEISLMVYDGTISIDDDDANGITSAEVDGDEINSAEVDVDEINSAEVEANGIISVDVIGVISFDFDVDGKSDTY